MTELTAHDIRRLERHSRDIRRIAISLEMLVKLVADYTGRTIPDPLELVPEMEDKFVPQAKRVVCQNNLNIGDIQAATQQTLKFDEHRPVWNTREAASQLKREPGFVIDRIKNGTFDGYQDLETKRWFVYQDSVKAYLHYKYPE